MTRICWTCIILLLLPSFALADDLQRGVEAFQKKDYEEAIKYLTAYIRDNPKDQRGYLLRGLAYDRKQAYDKAIADCTEAIRLDPKNSSAYALRGQGYLQKQEDHKAIADCSEAIRLDPKNYAALTDRGIAYGKKKDYDKAVTDYTDAIRLNPKAADVHNALAWILATCPRDALRDGKKAIEHATTACELSNWKQSAFLDSLAAAYAERGDFKEAVKWQQKVLEAGSPDKGELEEARRRLKLYEQGKPYREE